MSRALMLLAHPWLVTLGWLVVLSALTTSLAALALAGWHLLRRVPPPSVQYRAAVVALMAAVGLALAPWPLLVADAVRTPGSDVARPTRSPHDRGRSPASPTFASPRGADVTAGPTPARSPARLSVPPWAPGLLGGMWILGAATMSLRLLMAWLATHRLARRATWLDDGPLLETFERLTTLVHVRARLAVSSEIEAPAAVGVRDAMVLLPPHALEYLPHDSLAPVLAHELAHVARRDYAAHLTQSAIEAVLWHCPGVWWIGRRLREAREFCCDDASVAIAGSRARYIEALTLIARLGSLATRPAVGVAGPRLVTRVRRLLEGEPTMSHLLARAVVLTVLATTIAAALPTTFTWASRQLSAHLLAAGQEGPAVPRAFPLRQEGSALRIVRVEPTATHACGRFEVQNLAAVAVAQVRFVGVLSFRPGVDRRVQIRESEWITQTIPAGATATFDVPLVEVAEARRLAGGGHVQAHCAVRELVHENRVAWGITPNPAATTGDEALGFRRWSALPRALVGQTRAAAYPRLTLCLDEDAREYSPGAQVGIDNEPGNAARCTPTGQWVEVDARTGEPRPTAEQSVTLEVRFDDLPTLSVTSKVGEVASVQTAGGRTWGFVPTLTASGGVEVAVHDLSKTPHRLVDTRTLPPGVMTRIEAGPMDIGTSPR